MPLFTLTEVIHIVLTVLALGYIFSGWIRKPKHPLEMMGESRFFDWENVKFAAMVAAPAVVLHELGHKFVAVAYGYSAHYVMSTFGMAIGVVLRLVNAPFLFFLPGYVTVPGVTDPVTLATIAFAGPLVNLILFGASWALLNSNKYHKYNHMFYISKQINLLLFVFNMLPLWGLDGSKVYRGLFALL